MCYIRPSRFLGIHANSEMDLKKLSYTITFDKDVELMFVPTVKCVSRKDVEVRLCDSYNRKKLPLPAEENINEIWKTRTKENPKMFNGTKFRLDAASEVLGKVVLNLGITCYKDFIGTNWSPQAQDLLALGIKEFACSHAYMSDALGVGALLKTSDNYTVLMKRSEHCGEAVGLYDIPGGHPEPAELVGKVLMEEIDFADISESDVVNEIFDSTLREISEEVNVPLSTLTDPLLLGIARNTTSAGRPSSEYFVQCSLSSEEIKEMYKQGSQVDAEESTELLCIPISEVLVLQENKQLWEKLAPSAKGCITLYQIYTLSDQQA